MNEKDDPLATSFEAGAPLPGAVPPGPNEPSVAALASSPLDSLLAVLKSQERWGLAAGLGVQLLVLFAMIVMGALKVLTGGL